jgi:Apea-like HEPN
MRSVEFDSCTLYAGLAGVEVDFDNLDVTEGVSLRRMYAYFFMPMLMAFKKPSHLGRWAAVSDGINHDIHIELKLTEVCGAKFEEKLAYAKLITALLRLHASPHFSLVVISNVPIEEGTTYSDKPHFYPVEAIGARILVAEDRKKLSSGHFSWLTSVIGNAVHLNSASEPFAFALQALDSWTTAGNESLALVSMWAALENIFSPDKAAELRFRVSALIASYLERPGEARKNKFTHILRLYDARSKAAHGASKRDGVTLFKTYELLREVLIKIIEEKRTPTRTNLEKNLFGSSSFTESASETSPVSGDNVAPRSTTTDAPVTPEPN